MLLPVDVDDARPDPWAPLQVMSSIAVDEASNGLSACKAMAVDAMHCHAHNLSTVMGWGTGGAGTANTCKNVAFKEVVDKVVLIVKHFVKSPLASGMLRLHQQEYVALEEALFEVDLEGAGQDGGGLFDWLSLCESEEVEAQYAALDRMATGADAVGGGGAATGVTSEDGGAGGEGAAAANAEEGAATGAVRGQAKEESAKQLRIRKRNATRWSGLYKMLLRLMYLKAVICKYLDNHHKASIVGLNLLATEWLSVRQSLVFLKEAYYTSLVLQVGGPARMGPCKSALYDMVTVFEMTKFRVPSERGTHGKEFLCENDMFLEENTTVVDVADLTPAVAQMRKIIIEEIYDRKLTSPRNKSEMVALMCDPRFKDLHFLCEKGVNRNNQIRMEARAAFRERVEEIQLIRCAFFVFLVFLPCALPSPHDAFILTCAGWCLSVFQRRSHHGANSARCHST